MKTKALFVYIVLGIAFAAVSLWVFLSKGKNARAIRTKYKLGGAMIAAWAILSAANCQGPGPMVTCYEPVPPSNVVSLSLKDPEDKVINDGDILLVQIYGPTFDRYRVKITPDGSSSMLIQSETFAVTDKSEYVVTFEFQLDVDDFIGTFAFEVFGLTTEGDEEVETSVYKSSFIVE